MRDEFLNTVKRTLAERVGYLCSNPNCRKSTSGPRSDPSKSVNIGVAAHITAAAPGGPRYDPNLSSEERRSHKNGIWLCQNCAKLVDNDPEKYTSELLYSWKSSAEARASQRVRGVPPAGKERSTSIVVLADQLDRLARRVSSDIEKRLEDMREAWREGQREKAIEWLKVLKNDHVRWTALSSEVKAELLRFEAVLELDVTGDVSLVRQLADEARSLAPAYNDARLRALAVYYETGPETAMDLLTDQNDIDSLNLRAAFLLETGRISKGLKLLEVEDRNIEPNAETFRLRAISYLQTKDLSRARLEIRKALELKPSWESVRFTAATINYFGTLSPAALPGRLTPWPEPVHWVEVKNDDQSVSRLREAEQVFRDLSERPGRAGEERQRFEGWRLACLAIDADRQEEANEYCKTLLQVDPTHIPAISWAVARNYDVDPKPSKMALEKQVASGSPRIPDITALVACYLQSIETGRALRLLKETRTVFQESQADTVWAFWYAQSQTLDGDPEAALEAIAEFEGETELQVVRSIALGAIATENDNWNPLIQHLESGYEETKDPTLLLDLCGLKAQRQDWDYVADRAKLLIERFATSEVVRLGAIAAYNAHQFDFCLSLLDDHRELFRHQRLPAELRRIRVYCQRALGILPEAIVELETLVREEPTKDNLLALAQLYFDKGDLKGLAIIARQLSGRSDLTVEESLRISRLTQWEDRHLAKSLWRRAVSQGIPDPLVGEAMALGYELGLDRELKLLQSRMIELGQQGLGGIQVGTIQNLIAFARQHSEREKELNEAYRSGKAPIHIIAEQLNWPLVELYHGVPETREAAPDPIRQSLLLIRHGGRALVPGFPSDVPEWRLNLDLTALLMAAHLEIIDKVENVFAPLRIPAAIMPALIQMRERIAHHQPLRLEHCRQIVELVDEGALEVIECALPPDYANVDLSSELGEEFAALLETARGNEGYLVCFLPLRKQDLSGPPSALPEHADQYLVNCRGVIEALREQGPLSSVEYADGLRELGNEARKVVDLVPEKGSPLYCRGNIPDVLAGAGLLRTVCECFQVHIEQRELDRLRAELRGCERRQRVEKWLDVLIDRVSKGIDDGTYKVIPATSRSDGVAEETLIENPVLACLETLLRFDTEENDVIWSDDRYVNGYLRRDSVPIVGINEILKALAGTGALEVSDYYNRVNRLRAANMRFVPVQSDEILYQLRQVNIENNAVVETRELGNLRRYAAVCLLQSDILQKPPLPEGTPNKHGEIAFPLAFGSAVHSALTKLWMTNTDNESDRWARAEWLLRNLYLNHLGLRNLASLQRSNQDDLYLVALSLAGLISQAIAFVPDQVEDEPSPRRKYFDWLFNRVLRKRFEADSRLVSAVAELLKTTILSSQEDMTRDAEATPVELTWLLQSFYDDLPKPIRDALWLDTDFMIRIGIQPTYAITVGDLNFARGEFFAAASEAVNGRRATVTEINVDEEITFEPCEESDFPGVFCFENPETGERQAFGNQDLELLLDSPMEREAVLRRNRHWFDCSEETFDQAVAEIVSIEDPQRRVEEVRSWRESSASVFYDDLWKTLSKQPALEFALLRPPSANGLLRHLRLQSNVGSAEDFRDALNAAAQALIREEGLIPTINRLAGLPVPFPATLIETVADLPREDRYSLIKRLVRTAGSPVSRIHLVHLLLHCGDETTAFGRLARRIAKSLLSPERINEFRAFLAILQWVSDEFSQRSDMQTWPAHIRLALAWAHTHRLFATFAYLGVRPDWLQEKFDQANLRLSPEAFERDSSYWFDVNHPRRVNYIAFLICGLDYAFGAKGMQIVDGELRAHLDTMAFRDSEGIHMPVPALLRDYTRANNSLSSFLGGDLGKKASTLFAAESANAFECQSLQAIADHALETIADGEDELSGWLSLHTVLGDLPPYEDLSARLKSLIRETDFVALFERNIPAGNFGILTASLQAVHLSDQELRLYLKDQLVALAQLFASWESGEVCCSATGKEEFGKSKDLSNSLIESALNVALATQSSQEAITEFAEILQELVETWVSLVPACRPIVQALSEGLPIAQAQCFWPLLVRLRAE